MSKSRPSPGDNKYFLVFTHSTLCRRGIYVRLRPISRPVSIRLFVTSRSSIETDGRIELDFGMEASFDLFYAVF